MRSLRLQRENFAKTELMPYVTFRSVIIALFEPKKASPSVLEESHQGDRSVLEDSGFRLASANPD